MVRFKVIKGSHLLLGAAIAVLAIVISTLAIISLSSSKPDPVSAQASLVNVQTNMNEAETNTVFASTNVTSDTLILDPGQDDFLNIEIIGSATTAPVDKPSVLIYHTHTHEAYEQVSGDQYVAVEAWRTTDPGHSIVRVGSELAALLRRNGFNVVHDTTDHEQNELGTAYTRSLETLKGYTQTFDLYIDLHRDAYVEGAEEPELRHDNHSVARLMLLIGNGEGFEVKPYYEENLAFAQALTERINQELPGLCKEVLVKDGRYNQNIGIFSILVEVGHNRNTLQEALNTLPYLSDALYSLMIGNPDPELIQLQEAFRDVSS